MEKPNIICVDDQREVLTSVSKDLTPLKEFFNVEECETAAEAAELLEDLDAEGEHIALIVCDHIMPGKNGVDFLSEVHQDGRFAKTRMLLLTGLATHADTITAINQAKINCYIEKPWEPENLLKIIKGLLTEYVVESDLDHAPFLSVLDQEVLYGLLRSQT